MKPMTLKYKAGAIQLTTEQAAALFTPEELAAGERRADIETHGPWYIVSGCRALATGMDRSGSTLDWDGRDFVVYGDRKLSGARNCGYVLEGRVSVGGRTYRGFTSSALFELPDGRLISCATIAVCFSCATIHVCSTDATQEG